MKANGAEILIGKYKTVRIISNKVFDIIARNPITSLNSSLDVFNLVIYPQPQGLTCSPQADHAVSSGPLGLSLLCIRNYINISNKHSQSHNTTRETIKLRKPHIHLYSRPVDNIPDTVLGLLASYATLLSLRLRLQLRRQKDRKENTGNTTSATFWCLCRISL